MRDRRTRAVMQSRSWVPCLIPEIAAGYWWAAFLTTGFGATGFRVLEGNGHASFDFRQATILTQPTALAENGGVQFRMRKVADPNPSILSTAAAVQAGWTGSTYVAGWFRLPDASGDITGAGNLFVHTPATAGQRRFTLTNLINTTDRQGISTSNDGTTQAASQYTSILAGGAWKWVEALIVPGTSMSLLANFVAATAAVSANPASPLFDGNALISIASRAGASLANVDTTDWCFAAYGNGIPSLADRVRLANFTNPTGIPLAA